MALNFYDPNSFGFQTDSENIQAAVDEAEKSGCGRVVIPSFNERTGKYLWTIGKTIRIPSHMTITIDGAHLRMQDGVMCRMFENSLADTDLGDTPEGLQEDIILEGQGRAILDGGLHNGLRERTAGKDGLPSVSHNLMVHLHHVKNFRISGLTIRDQRWYGICMIWCWEGIIKDLRFEIGEKCVRESLDRPWKNQDGVDLRVGCHDIQIMNLTGETGDDIVALNALAIGDCMENRHACRHLSRDIWNVSIHHITGYNNHCKAVRLLCHDGNVIRNIAIDTLIDSTPDDMSLIVPEGQRTSIMVEIGENDYVRGDYSKLCRLGQMRDISVSNIFSNCLAAVALNCTAENVIIRNVFVGKRGGHAVAVAKIKRGVYDEVDNPVNVTYLKNILVDGVCFESQREGAVPFYFDAMKAENFRVANVSAIGCRELAFYRREQETEAVDFRDCRLS